jgi:SAM-dependent methyltransferase
MSRVYDRYFRTGYYDQRYPVANRHTFHLILSALEGQEWRPKHILDFGCGNGRYLLPVLKRTDDNFTAYDISKTTLELLAERLDIEGEKERVSIIHGDLGQLAEHIREQGPVDLIMLMFGVLSHVGEREQRLLVLRELRSFLADSNSLIILSVPNRLRRFKEKTGGNNGGDIVYSRKHQGEELTFFYHLYTPAELKVELEEAGYVVHEMSAESYFPESWVTRSKVIGSLDRAICRVLPTHRGYGILAIAGPR